MRHTINMKQKTVLVIVWVMWLAIIVISAYLQPAEDRGYMEYIPEGQYWSEEFTYIEEVAIVDCFFVGTDELFIKLKTKLLEDNDMIGEIEIINYYADCKSKRISLKPLTLYIFGVIVTLYFTFRKTEDDKPEKS